MTAAFTTFGDFTLSLMGLGRIGPPFLHDGRVYLSTATVDTTPAGTVTTNSTATNVPLVVRTVDDAILATIELHDLLAPDDTNTPKGGGCPFPPEATSSHFNVDYGRIPRASSARPSTAITGATRARSFTGSGS